MEYALDEVRVKMAIILVQFNKRFKEGNPVAGKLAIDDILAIPELARCVNSHDSLVEALEAWDELYNLRPLDSGADINLALRRCWGKTQAALALTKEA